MGLNHRRWDRRSKNSARWTHQCTAPPRSRHRCHPNEICATTRYLRKADFFRAHLEGADLSGGHLAEAEGLTQEQIDQAIAEENEARSSLVVRVSGTQGIAYSGNYGKIVEGSQGSSFEGGRAVYDILEAEPVDYEVGDEEGAFAFFQKIQHGEGILRVEILKDGEAVASRETSAELATVDVVWPPQVETTTGIPQVPVSKYKTT